MLLLHPPPRMPRILPTHGPRAFGEAFGVGLDGIELFVTCPDVNRAIRSDGGGGEHMTSRFKFPEDGAGFLLVCTRQRQTQNQQSYEGGFHRRQLYRHHERGQALGGGLITATAVTAAALLARASLTSAVSVPDFGLLPVQNPTPPTPPQSSRGVASRPHPTPPATPAQELPEIYRHKFALVRW